ncbi:hypothetical protein SBX64_19450 [Vibrio rhizosphaerae]|uniref:Glycoside hydrolase family 19 catalytic domain-containing protein n=1 Tax=Vibrio rhizosphaerae TaxID=398736 RepID=A0ABU4IZ85_9VIBR|nr:hypothetical protein [Vibrio rhizosphaerae]MDW6094726.1 hypothetical protein [Vibrio rhizosphaerae]
MSSIALKEILTNKEYTFKENINLDNNTSVMASFQLQDKNGKLLGKEIPKNLKIKDKKVSTKVKVEDLAKQNKVSVKDIYKLMASIDVDNDKVFQKNERTTVEVIPMILKSDLFKDSKVLNKLAVKRSKGYKKGIKKNEEVKLIQKGLVKLGLDLGDDGDKEGDFEKSTKDLFQIFQIIYEPTHKIHKDYKFGGVDGIVGQNGILALDEALKEEWEHKFKCACSRDFTVDEVKLIVKVLRKSEYKKSLDLFDDSDCDIPDKDKTYERFTEELNKVCKTYEINTCIRKIHFLTQIYHESSRLKTAIESGDGSAYDPANNADATLYGNTSIGDGAKYRGRGLMQLTWKNTYYKYKDFSGSDVIMNYTDVSDDLGIAMDSAGWFFKQGKVLSASGETWSAPANAPSYVKKYNASYTKNIISYDSGKKKYGTLNMNLIADDDYIDLISWLVNGGNNGLKERRKYNKILKGIFCYEKCSNK